MSSSSQIPWSDNPNAPRISRDLYFWEKATLAGRFVSAIFYGIVVMLFFQCVATLLDPANRRKEGIKRWGLIAYVVVMFSFVTVYTGMGSDILSISFIDNREFPGVGNTFPPGPVGYQYSIYSEAISLIPSIMFLFNNWLADGLLLYRCYILYGMNIWVIALPCLLCLGSVVMGIMLVYQTSRPGSEVWTSLAVNFGLGYFSLSLSLNILLTLMIVTRLILHTRNIMGAPARVYRAIITMLIESSALYAINSLLFVGPWGAGNHAADIFLPILAQTQVIAPLLIIQRVANRRALTSNCVVTGSASSAHFRNSARTEVGDQTLPGGYPMQSVHKCENDLKALGVRVETTIDFHRDSKV